MSKAPKTRGRRGRRNISRLFCLYTTRNRKPKKWHPVFDYPRVRGISIPLTVNARGLWGRDCRVRRVVRRVRESPWHFDPADRKCARDLGTRLSGPMPWMHRRMHHLYFTLYPYKSAVRSFVSIHVPIHEVSTFVSERKNVVRLLLHFQEFRKLSVAFLPRNQERKTFTTIVSS